MAPSPEILAVIFDFDDTLAPDSTTRLLESYGYDTDAFWKKEVRAMVAQGYDPTLAWLNLVLADVRAKGALAGLSNRTLREFGASLDDTFFPGIPEIFHRLRESVSNFRDISIEFYVISSGLRELLLGSEIVRSNITEVYACEFGENQDGVLQDIKRCVTFTEKTRYLFEINKGLPLGKTAENPLLVNTDVPKELRRISFQNMIYVGDGQTDIPCFSLVREYRGLGFGVFDPKKKDKAKQALLDFLRPQRVLGMYEPLYRETDALGSLIDQAVATRCSQIELERDQGYGTR
jgi:phosphoserine phosphatase